MADKAGGSMAVRVIMDSSGQGELAMMLGRLTRNVVAEIAQDAKRRVPVDTGELRASIRTTYRARHGRVWVGTDHWAPTEYGSAPHKIRVRSAKVLHNAELNEFYGREVNHPGTPEQPFMRPAAYTKRRLGMGGVVL
jgi:hypothetical protein